LAPCLFFRKTRISGDWLVLGLGNPGPEYEQTRHNAGFAVADRLAPRLGVRRWRPAFSALVGEGRADGVSAAVAKPQTFMNESGRAASALAEHMGLSGDRILVVHDDVDLPFGRIRLKRKGGDGGHNGLRSIIKWLGHGRFPRLRMGIGRPKPGETMTGHVLSPFDDYELQAAGALWDLGAEAVRTVLLQGMDEAMNRFNNRQVQNRDA